MKKQELKEEDKLPRLDRITIFLEELVCDHPLIFFGMIGLLIFVLYCIAMVFINPLLK